MKRTINLILIVCASAISVNAQTFEGKVVYQNTYLSPNGEEAAAQLESMLGANHEYYVKGGSYKTVANANAYKNHKMGNWCIVAKMAGLPLKTITETPQFRLITVATKVTPMKLDDSMFTLPKGAKTEKSPY